MVSDIIIELEENIKQLNLLISAQKFSVGDAKRFLGRYYNILRKMEQLTDSREMWKAKYLKLKEKI